MNDQLEVLDEKALAVLSRQKIQQRVRALATAQALAWYVVLTPDQREDCIAQAIAMQNEKPS